MMPICPQCGTHNPPENTTCRSCGALLEVPPAPAPPVAPEEAAPSPTAPEQVPLSRAVVFGLAAAVVLGGIWFVAEYLTHQPLPFLAPLIGWGVAEAVVWGAGRRRSRELQWLALGLTLLAVVGTLLALAATDPAGFSDGLQLRLQDIFSLLLYLLSLFVAYASPAPRPAPRPQPQEQEAEKKVEGAEEEKPAEEGEGPAEAEPALRCVRCQSPTTEEEALMLPARRGQMVALCPRCVAEIEARFAAESENIQIGPAVLYGLGAALAGGILWYLAERFSGMGLAFLAFVFGWLIAEAVRLGAGRKRGRVLQGISLGLTLAMIVGTQVALAATALPAQDGRPSWSPDGTRLAFQSDRSGNWEIYVLQADGSGGSRLTNNADADMSPAWSPGGRHLAFQSDRGGGWSIYTMNADGTEVTRLATALPDGEEPAWSPDGSRLALVSRSDGNAEIYVVNADGSGLLRLTENAADDEHPSWSPDGTRLAFASERDGNWEIYTMNADGTGVARLTDHPAADRSPAWSPDGGSIAFVSERDGNAEIYRMDVEGNHLRRLTQEPAEDGDPAWSPEGKLAFRSERDGDAEIYQMDADGGQVRPLTRDPSGVMEVLLARLQDPFTLILFLLGLFQAYSAPAPRRLPRRKQEGSPGR